MIWHKISESELEINWQLNGMCLVQVGDKTVTLARHQGGIFAFAHKCPHASGIMADGHLNAAGQVTCPIHRYKFAIQNGRNTSGEGYFLKTYAVEKREDGIYIGWEDKKIWDI